MRKALGLFISSLGGLGFLWIIFFGYPLHYFEQLERGKDLQALADPSQFSQEELAQIDQEVEYFRKGVERGSPGMDPYAKELLAVQTWAAATVAYDSDLRNYGMLEYLATAREAWLRKRDDCDGTAALAAAILKASGVEQAKIAVSDTHAEARIGETVLPPEPPLPRSVPWYRHLERVADRLTIFPWGRAALGLVWFLFCCRLGAWVAREHQPFYLTAAVLGLIFGFLLLEYFTIHYLPNPLYHAQSQGSLIAFFAALIVGGVSAFFFLFGRIFFRLFRPLSGRKGPVLT